MPSVSVGFKSYGHRSHIANWSRSCRNNGIQTKLELNEQYLKRKYETKGVVRGKKKI